MQTAAAAGRAREAWATGTTGGARAAVAGAFAAIMLTVSAAATILEQSAVDEADARTARRAPEARDGGATDGASTLIAAYGGVPYTYPSDFVLQRPGLHDLTVKDVAWEGKPFKSPIYYGARVARWPDNSSIGGMVDFTHSKAISRFDDVAEMKGTLGGAPAPGKARIGDVFRHLEFSHGHNMLTLNGLYRLPRIGLRLVPYLGAGAGVSVPHTEIALKSDAKRTYEYQYAGPIGQALIGVEIRLPRISWLIEYKFTYAPYSVPLTFQNGFLAVTDLWAQFRRWSSGEAPPGGFARAQLTSHQVISGLGMRIEPAAALP